MVCPSWAHPGAVVAGAALASASAVHVFAPVVAFVACAAPPTSALWQRQPSVALTAGDPDPASAADHGAPGPVARVASPALAGFAGPSDRRW